MPQKRKPFKKIRISVNGKPTKFKIGDYIKFNEKDVNRCITQISIDSDGCVNYLVSYLNDKDMTAQWMSENDFNIMESLTETPKILGFS